MIAFLISAMLFGAGVAVIATGRYDISMACAAVALYIALAAAAFIPRPVRAPKPPAPLMPVRNRAQRRQGSRR